MTDQEQKESRTAKMQKLRRAVERIRNVGETQRPTPTKGSWFKRLTARLGLSSESETNPED